jgi:transcriptional regulator with XRE-family HTH domain
VDALKERLAEALKHAGKSRGQLAAVLGVTEAAIGALVRGTSKQMTGENLIRAARFLGVNPYWLATGEESMLDEMTPEAREIAKRLDQLKGMERNRALALCRLACFSPPPPEGVTDS